MCSYNRINGDYACENDYTLNQVLKHDWGFKGFVLSDWGGTHSTVKAALAGLDMDQPGDDNFFSEPLKQAVLAGTVPQARLDDMVHRIVRSMFAAGVIDQPPMPRSSSIPSVAATIPRDRRRKPRAAQERRRHPSALRR
jgi:beta-glucosidase